MKRFKEENRDPKEEIEKMKGKLKYVEQKLEKKEKFITNIIIRGLEANKKNIEERVQKVIKDQLAPTVTQESAKILTMMEENHSSSKGEKLERETTSNKSEKHS